MRKQLDTFTPACQVDLSVPVGTCRATVRHRFRGDPFAPLYRNRTVSLIMEPGNAQLSMTGLMTPDMANFSGNVHGGTLLKYLDEVAYACASRYAGTYVVTLSVDQVIFREPVHVGELVTFLASVNYTGTTSPVRLS